MRERKWGEEYMHAYLHAHSAVIIEKFVVNDLSTVITEYGLMKSNPFN